MYKSYKTIMSSFHGIYDLLVEQDAFSKILDFGNKEVKEKFTPQEIMVHKQLFENAKISQNFDDRSEELGSFVYDSWKCVIPESAVEIQPKLEYFSCLQWNQKDFAIMVDFYKKYQVSEMSVEEFLQLKIPTFREHSELGGYLNLLGKHWKDLTWEEKETSWCLVTGFKDNVMNLRGMKIIHKTRNYDFIKEEIKAKRMLEVKEIPFTEFIACNYFAIPEEKIDNKGVKYIKNRWVSNNTHCNEFLEPIAEKLSYNFPTVEGLFKNKTLYQALIISSDGAVFDRSEFYRSLPMIPSKLSFLGCDGRYFADRFGKMGHKYMGAFAQKAANLHDRLFSLHKKGMITVRTMQDDSLYLHMFGVSPVTEAEVKQFNDQFWFKINDKKTQIGGKLTWGGYEIDLKDTPR